MTANALLLPRKADELHVPWTLEPAAAAYVPGMKLTLSQTSRGSTAVVVLSRRNLLALLHKLEMTGSARTIASTNAYRVDDEGTPQIAHDLVLIVQSETDAEHYGERPFPAGGMHPDTEAFIADSSG